MTSAHSFGWGKAGNVTSAGWQVTLCDPMWHVSSRSGVATLRTAIHLLLTYLQQFSKHLKQRVRDFMFSQRGLLRHAQLLGVRQLQLTVKKPGS